MQITVKSSKVLTRGKNNYGDWALVKVVTDKDVEYTTLHKNAEDITAGMTLNIDELSMEVKDDKERWSFKKFEIITAPEKSADVPTDKMTTDQWAEKDRLERWSRECNTCFMGIVQLATSETIQGIELAAPIKEKLEKVFEASLDWAMAHFKPPLTYEIDTQQEKTSDRTPGKASAPEKADNKVDTLLSWIAENLNWKDAKPVRSWIVNKCKIPQDRIESDTENVMKEIALLQDWTLPK